MHTCMTTDPCYVHQKIRLDSSVIFYFIHRVIFPRYLVTRNKKQISQNKYFLTQLVTAFGLGKIFSNFWFSGCGDNILQKYYLLNKIRNDPCNKTKFWMCISCGFVHACMLKMSQSMICAGNDKICVDACSPMVCISRDPP